MNKFEQAISELRTRAGRTLKTPLSIETARLAIEAMEYRAEREHMRCENCKYFVIHKQNSDMTCKNMLGFVFVKPNDFCSEFKPKENENG